VIVAADIAGLGPPVGPNRGMSSLLGEAVALTSERYDEPSAREKQGASSIPAAREHRPRDDARVLSGRIEAGGGRLRTLAPRGQQREQIGGVGIAIAIDVAAGLTPATEEE
jgi:hypothetical protein